jgi:probable rRNA maturation factor
VAESLVSIVNRQRGRRIDTARLRAFLERLLRAQPPPRPVELVVCLISDRRMRELNRVFRGADRTTDVLSFPYGASPARAERPPLGDLAISVPAATRQARAAGHTVERELDRLALHGYLHLLGHDHERDDGRMLRLERRLRRRLFTPSASARRRSTA